MGVLVGANPGEGITSTTKVKQNGGVLVRENPGESITSTSKFKQNGGVLHFCCTGIVWNWTFKQWSLVTVMVTSSYYVLCIFRGLEYTQ